MPDERDAITEYLHAFQNDGSYTCVVCGENSLVHQLARRAHSAELRVVNLMLENDRLKSQPPSHDFGVRPVF